ncbi:MAG: glycosyltransferase [Phycisphaeraceae bacterium]|nr:glycosyltransferase [Phycisphaeraceae bacterium]
MITYVIPTRNRPHVLRATLTAIDALGSHHRCGGAEVIVVDNASDGGAPNLPRYLACGTPVRVIPLDFNAGAAARNVGARAADPASDWLVMLDDDSWPADTDFLGALACVGGDVAAVSADIFLPPGADGLPRRESGGLPEVFVGCGVAVRRAAFLEAGGYDASFQYYAEEYDLAARFLLMGLRTVFDPAFIVTHRKHTSGRDMNTILARLVRNNGWVARRYAPLGCYRDERARVLRRYWDIARAEGATEGYSRGVLELRAGVRRQRRTPLPGALWDRFTGLAQAREALTAAWRGRRGVRAALVSPGKNAWAVERAMRELGATIVADERAAESLVVGTLSPGPMLDCLTRRAGEARLVAPWLGAWPGRGAVRRAA